MTGITDVGTIIYLFLQFLFKYLYTITDLYNSRQHIEALKFSVKQGVLFSCCCSSIYVQICGVAQIVTEMEHFCTKYFFLDI